jgi:hypothetical protein
LPGSSPQIAPGQSWTDVATNAQDDGGNGQPWTSGKIVSYDLLTSQTGTTVGTYAPVKATAP